MTLIERNMLTPPHGEGREPPSMAQVLSAAIKAIRRHLWLVAASVGVCIILSLISIVIMTPIYQATTTIYIDPRESRGFQEAGGILLSSDALVVDSEVEILMSNALAERVVDKLGLATLDPGEGEEPANPNFTAPAQVTLCDTEEADKTGVLSPQEAAKRRAVSKLRRSMEIGRLGNTYVIEITAKHTDKQKVAAIANAYSTEYLTSGLEVQAERLANSTPGPPQRCGGGRRTGIGRTGGQPIPSCEPNRFRGQAGGGHRIVRVEHCAGHIAQ